MKLRRYVSEFEQFLDDFKSAHPDVEEDQQRGWYIWWDHNQDRNEAERVRKDSVPTAPYYYP